MLKYTDTDHASCPLAVATQVCRQAAQRWIAQLVKWLRIPFVVILNLLHVVLFECKLVALLVQALGMFHDQDKVKSG